MLATYMHRMHKITTWAELLRAWLALTIGYAVSKPIRCQGIKRWLALTMLRATGPRRLGLRAPLVAHNENHNSVD